MTLKVVPAIHRATHHIEMFIEGLDLEVTQAEAHILAHLFVSGDSVIGDVHRAFGHKRSTLTSIIDRLVKRGLATRERSPVDGRSYVLTLTDEGQALAKQVYRQLKRFEEQLLARFSESERQGLLELLEAIQ